MSKPKFTPGPWFNHGRDGLFDARTHGPSIQDAKGNVICAVETVDGDAPDELNEERLANAHLIAAAVDMYEALKLFESSEDAWANVVTYINSKGDAAPAALAVAFERMRSAIAKAEGGENE